MQKGLFLSCCFLFILHFFSFCQDYSYTHYDISEGLAGSTAYCMTQDKDGFIWTGTEAGVSRFDGTHFRNFTAMDGLPDVEVLNMFSDSKGRVWMAPFRKSICYYYKGKIHNPENDQVLGQIHLKNNIEYFAENDKGDILIQEREGLHVIGEDGRLKEYDSVGGLPIDDCTGVSRSLSGHFLVQVGDTLYELANDRFHVVFFAPFAEKLPNYLALSPRTMISRTTPDTTLIISLETGRKIRFPFGRAHISYSIVADSLAYMNKTSGSVEYNIHSGTSRSFLPGIEVTCVFRDDEGNTWFTTVGQGIFRLNSGELRNIELHVPDFGQCAVHSIKRAGNALLLGTNHQIIFRFHLPGFLDQLSYKLGTEENSRIITIEEMKDGSTVYGTDYNMVKVSPDLKPEAGLHIGVKASFRKNEKECLFASAHGVYLVDMKAFRVMDTLMHKRATTVFYRKDTIYVGTLDGVYLILKDRSVVYLGDKVPFLKKRIAAIVSSRDGTLWIASYDAGIIGYRNGRIVAAITSKQGLTSDICRTLAIHTDDLWVGTDKGLNRIDLGKPGYMVTRYTFHDGLGSNMINTIYADSTLVYVGTPAGLSFFDQTKVDPNSGCRLRLLAAISSGRDIGEGVTDFSLPYTDNNIRFEFVGISYRSAGNIMYRYRLTGLDSNWKDTKESFLEYPTLSSGIYELQLIAINKFGVPSRPLSIHFTIATPFWKTAWFTILLVSVFLLFCWLLFSLRLRNIRRRQKERDQLAKRIGEMEHMALQAQMNPHFIFNCLNSIQQFVFNKDIFAANKYITGFARLIRSTLHNSTQTNISLADEVRYLSGYLELEKLRYKDKLNYAIEVDELLNPREILVPPMLIQPFVENSIRHGLRHKTDGEGYVRIYVAPVDGVLVITIEDNGIGREKSAEYKTREHIEYHSQGVSMTTDRIRLINSVYGNSISLDMVDLYDEHKRSAGTRVLIRFQQFKKAFKTEKL